MSNLYDTSSRTHGYTSTFHGPTPPVRALGYVVGYTLPGGVKESGRASSSGAASSTAVHTRHIILHVGQIVAVPLYNTYVHIINAADNRWSRGCPPASSNRHKQADYYSADLWAVT